MVFPGSWTFSWFLRWSLRRNALWQTSQRKVFVWLWIRMCLFSLNFDVNFLSQSAKKINEDVFCQIYWITWNLALKWSFAGVRVFMLPEMEMFFFLQFIDRNWLIVRYARIQRWSLHNIVAFSCRMHKSHVTRHSIFATCNLTAAAFHYKCFQRFSKSNLQFCVNFTL